MNLRTQTQVWLFLLLMSSSAFSLPEDSSGELNEMILLRIAKSEYTAVLSPLSGIQSPSSSLHKFKIAYGRAFGDKQKEGDLKTPEGIYLPLKHINTQKIQPKKYGSRAISLNYPNGFDQLHRKSGSGIWLHGAGNDARISNKNVTEGCIAFYNSEILKLINWIQPNKAIVAIAENMSDINRKSDLEAVTNQTDKWIKAWQIRNNQEYTNSYHPNFLYKGMDLNAFKKYKKRVFSQYNKMLVEISQLRVISHPKYAVAIMNQSFNGDDRFISIGRKILYWSKDKDNQWKIRHEYFDQKRFEKLSYSLEDIKSLQVKRIVKNTSN